MMEVLSVMVPSKPLLGLNTNPTARAFAEVIQIFGLPSTGLFALLGRDASAVRSSAGVASRPNRVKYEEEENCAIAVLLDPSPPPSWNLILTLIGSAKEFS